MQEEIIEKIIELKGRYGENILDEPKRLLAMIKDYFPYAKHEHYLLSISLPLHLYALLKGLKTNEVMKVRNQQIKNIEKQYLVPHQWAEEMLDLWCQLVEREKQPIGGQDENLCISLDSHEESSLNPKIEGSLQAILHKANCYYNGEGIEENRLEALKWYEKAALLGSVEAMNYVGNIYYMGEGVPKNEGLALKWYMKAAQLESSLAMNYIGNMYCEGRGVARDFEKACYWYGQAVAKGNYTAMFNLGYINCEAFLRQDLDGLEEIHQRAENGEVKAMYHMAYCYHWGEGVPVDYEAARKWYECLAQKGEQTAMIWLAYMYFNGQGVEKSVDEARQWCEKAIKTE